MPANEKKKGEKEGGGRDTGPRMKVVLLEAKICIGSKRKKETGGTALQWGRSDLC